MTKKTDAVNGACRQPAPAPCVRLSPVRYVLLALLLAPVSLVAAPQSPRVLAGIDVLQAQLFAPLAGKRIGLITNHTGTNRQGRSTIDLLAHAPGVKLVALFSPEHGIRGEADGRVAAATDEATGLPIYSLYGDTLRPTAAMLRGVDALVFDIQDAGVRFYTYITTLGYTMEAAAEHHLAYYVLDRPNPLGGEAIEGPMLDAERTNFVGYFPMPVRTGMTLGELALMFNTEKQIGCDLHVIAMQGWRRSDRFSDTGWPWMNPSPNLRSTDAALLYPGLEILQAAGVSVGRGTAAPFERFGAPWIRGEELVASLRRRPIPGVRFEADRYTPDSGLHHGTMCQGARVILTDPASLQSMRMGMEIASALSKLYPNYFDTRKIIELLGNGQTVERLERGEDPAAIVASWDAGLRAFRAMRARYLLYR